ncbi:MAG: DUF2279 domain-containing protein, partial [Bacteroidota bacterium]
MNSFRFFFIVILLLFLKPDLSQSQSGLQNFLKPSDTLNSPRKKGIIITESALAAATLIGLDQLWYADFERSKFRTINDSNEWLQMDKFGHVFSA